MCVCHVAVRAGLCTLAIGVRNHHKSDLPTGLASFRVFNFIPMANIMVVCLAVTLLVQLIVPAAIFSESFYAYYQAVFKDEDDCDTFHGVEHCPESDYDERAWVKYLCPDKRTKSKQQVIIMVCIAAMYFARLTLLAIKKGNGTTCNKIEQKQPLLPCARFSPAFVLAQSLWSFTSGLLVRANVPQNVKARSLTHVLTREHADATDANKGHSRPFFITSTGKKLKLHTDLIAYMRIDKIMDVICKLWRGGLCLCASAC